MRWSILVSLLCLTAACGSNPPPTQTPDSSGGAVVPIGSASASAGPVEPGTPPDNGQAAGGKGSGTDPTNGTSNAATDCGGKACGAGEECISYYGIAGPRGPQFHDCGIRCRRGGGVPNDGCPNGTKCVTIADGPGDVCK